MESNFKKKIAGLPSENKKDIEKIQTRKWENIAETFLRKEIYTEADAQKYLDDVVSEIVNNNQTLQNKSFMCYFSKSEVPNASFIGEGVILFNLGLLDKLENESQLAFILCHEIAHFYIFINWIVKMVHVEMCYFVAQNESQLAFVFKLI